MNKKEASRRHAHIIATTIFAISAIPTIVVGSLYYHSFKKGLTNEVSDHVRTLEALSGKAIALRLDTLVSMANSYANQPSIQNAAATGAWSAGISAIQKLQENPVFYDSYIDRIFLIDLNGKINGAFPGIAAESVGTIDGSYDTWRQSLIGDKAPLYISNVVLRSVSPRMNVIKILVPIVKNATLVGILRFDIPINEFNDLAKNAELTSDGFVYFTDPTGQIISHPKISSGWPIVSFASIPSIERAMQGKNGVEILYNNLEQEERITAYGQVPEYRWNVVAQEPTEEAFRMRNAILIRILLMTLSMVIVEFALAAFVFMRELRKQNG